MIHLQGLFLFVYDVKCLHLFNKNKSKGHYFLLHIIDYLHEFLS